MVQKGKREEERRDKREGEKMNEIRGRIGVRKDEELKKRNECKKGEDKTGDERDREMM